MDSVFRKIGEGGILQPRASDVAVGTRQSPYACVSDSCVNSPFIGCVDYTADYNGNVVARAT